MTLRVLLVDDHAIVREGYRALLEKQADLRVVGEAANGEEAYLACLTDAPDVVVMDLTMPGASGVATIARLRRRHPQLRILVLTMHEESAFAVQALRAGAAGYVTKSSPPALLLEALRDVHRGARPLSPDVAHAMALQSFERDSLADLTPREFSILQALVDGNSTSAIAEQLHLSPKTVAQHPLRHQAQARRDLRHRARAARAAAGSGGRRSMKITTDMRKTGTGGLVYSTEGGRMCPACRKPTAECICSAQPVLARRENVVLRVSRETKGRGGKAVTVVRGLEADAVTLAALGKQLRTLCGSGGTVKDGVIEVQGDHRERVIAHLAASGWKAKSAGG